MKFKIITILLLITFHFGFPQEQDLDSIKQQIETYKKRDTIRVNLLNQLTRYYATREISKNEAILNEAIIISKEINYTQGLSDSYTNLTSFHVQSGNYGKALELALKTKKIQEEISDFAGLIYTNSSIARIYNHLEESNKAIEIQLENLELIKKNPNKNIEAQVHFYLGTAYTEVEKYDDAEFHYKAAKQIAESVSFETGIAIANSSLGVIENKRRNYKAAITYLNQSLTFFKKNNQNANVAHSNLELAVSFANTGRIGDALDVNEEAIKIYKDQNNFKSLSRAYLEQSDYFKRKNDYLNANKYLEEHYKVKDSIFSKEKVSVIEEMQIKYETEKVQKEKELAEKQVAITQLESDKNRNLFLGSLLIAGLILLSSLFYFSRLKAKKKADLIKIELQETQKRLAIEKQYRDSELKALKAQMNPHFIFNALNSIQDYIVLNQKNLASDYLGKFADLIRNYLHFSDTGFISIPEEVHNLNLYLELEKLRFEEQLEYTFQVEEAANSDALTIPTMLIQPYVENALKHGLLHKKDNRKLNISISKTSDKIIECSIVDNGIGRERSREINKKRAHHHKSFALKATTERLDLLNYGREKKIGVTIIDLQENNEATGTKVVLKIPIIKK
ncbi:tetratricopeptide repeat-containing sensor histidine kinase [Lacinutrix jangbogonensis]|uniref:tetratricopeptide repeat-containing sensor histidine kinase n=1 Tax=Lacinutrix jangbogonensis TaxID=1469557 RepID=UPI00053EF16E|nr:histidine kinase [Lacinutrix jangbogonensis]